MRSRAVLASLIFALAYPAVGFARGLEDDLHDVEEDIALIGTRVHALSDQVRPGGGFITPAEAVKRYQDYVYLYMVGDYQTAAEGFFALVTTAALTDEGMHLDAEWYLAESLYKMGNVVTAEARFQVIAEDAGHPFRDDAVRRLLELYAKTGQTQAFYAYYEQEIVRGRVRPSDLITYSVAKSFHAQGDVVRAKSNLLDIAPESPYYRKARYFLGAILVQEGNLDEAAEYFVEVADASVESFEDRQLLDLSLLALGRICLEQGDFPGAAEYYARIGGDSEFLADKLYELVWTFIKQSQQVETYMEDHAEELAEDEDRSRELETEYDGYIEQAQRGVEIFLLAFPEHEYTAQLKLLEGHLYMRAHDHTEALSTYEEVILDYTPVRERFADLATSDEDPQSYFQRVLGMEQGSDNLTEGLPAYALAMMMADSDLSESLDVYRSLQQQRTNVETSEALIAELETVLDASVGIGGFEQIRYDAILNQTLALQSQVRLLEYEEDWLRGALSGSDKRALDALRAQRVEIEARAEDALSVSETAQVEMKAYQTERRRVRRERDDLLRSQTSLREEQEGIQRRIMMGGEQLDPMLRADLEARLSQIVAEQSDVASRLPEVEVEYGQILSSPPSNSGTHSLETVLADIDALHGEYQARFPDSEAAARTRFDTAQGELGSTQALLTELLVRLDLTEGNELDRIRARFNHEVKEVASERVELERTLRDAEDVTVLLTRAGFGRLEDFFAESVLRADMGIVDVYWAEKVNVAEQRSEVQYEREALRGDLDQRFTFIRQKMKQ